MAGNQCLRCRAALRQSFHIRQTLTTCKTQSRSYSVQELETPKVRYEQVNNNAIEFPDPSNRVDIKKLLSKPTWSVRSLVSPSKDTDNATEKTADASNTISPSPTTDSPTEDITTSSGSTEAATEGKPPSQPTTPIPTITPSQLRHLLRLSALPQPRSPSEEASMLSTLHQQLHFVRAIQSTDTTGVEPLVTIRDETEEGIKESTIGLDNDAIKEALAKETRVGKWGRARRFRNNEMKHDGNVKEEVISWRRVALDRRYEEEQEWDPLKAAEGRTVGRYFVVDGMKKGPVARMGEAKEAAAKISAASEAAAEDSVKETDGKE